MLPPPDIPAIQQLADPALQVRQQALTQLEQTANRDCIIGLTAWLKQESDPALKQRGIILLEKLASPQALRTSHDPYGIFGLGK